MQAYAVVGDALTFLASSAETGGAYAAMISEISPGGGPPLHVHHREEETFFILNGVVTFYVGDERLVAGPNTFIRGRVGIPHRFRNETSEPARMLIFLLPGGLERMFLEVGAPLEPGQAARPPSADELARLLDRAPAYGVDILDRGPAPPLDQN